jgi:hypothetical protein
MMFRARGLWSAALLCATMLAWPNHAPVTEVGPHDDFGLKVVEHAREHDIVCKVRS